MSQRNKLLFRSNKENHRIWMSNLRVIWSVILRASFRLFHCRLVKNQGYEKYRSITWNHEDWQECSRFIRKEALDCACGFFVNSSRTADVFRFTYGLTSRPHSRRTYANEGRCEGPTKQNIHRKVPLCVEDGTC